MKMKLSLLVMALLANAILATKTKLRDYRKQRKQDAKTIGTLLEGEHCDNADGKYCAPGLECRHTPFGPFKVCRKIVTQETETAKAAVSWRQKKKQKQKQKGKSKRIN